MVSKVVTYVRHHHVGLVALFIALGGTAYAASLPRNSVGTSQLKNNAVTSAKVKDGSLQASDFRAGDLPRGPAGPVGQGGPAGVAGATGTRGDRGPSDAYGSFFAARSMGPAGAPPLELARQTLPAGDFVASANFIVQSSPADSAPRKLTCGLYFDGEGI